MKKDLCEVLHDSCKGHFEQAYAKLEEDSRDNKKFMREIQKCMINKFNGFHKIMYITLGALILNLINEIFKHLK